VKQNCIFEKCLFKKHNSLNCEGEHIRYYFEEVIGMDPLTETQVRLFKALSPIWKGMVLDRIYQEIYWPRSLSDVLKIDNDLIKYNQEEEDDHLMADWIEPEVERAEWVHRQEDIDKRRRRGEKYEFKKSLQKKDFIHQKMKQSYERNSLNKFIVRDQRKVEQSKKCANKKKGSKSRKSILPINMKGYK
jgi:hypothetical protein